MADQDQVDTDYSGRPFERPTVDEILISLPLTDSPFDLRAALPDGREAVYGGRGRYYLVRDDGRPDWDRPVWIEGLSSGEPVDGDEIIR